ncbi:MAG: hypothetical protein HOW73_48855 [Polyangiaceae bacterium]|nr:hypothetical protein [Polyangiaceae bacterium]
MFRTNPSDHPAALAVLTEELRAAGREWYRAGFALVGAMAVVAGLTVWLAPAKAGLAAVAALGIPIAGALWWRGHRLVRDAHPVLDALRTDRNVVVWIYARSLDGDPLPTVTIGMTDGRLLDVPIARKHEERALSALAELCPSATLGFTPERALAFHRAPASLRREASSAGPVRTDMDPSADRLRALVPYALHEISRKRRLYAAMGICFLLPGGLGVTIAAAAATGSERWALLATFILAAVIPGLALCVAALRSRARHPLALALSGEPSRIEALYPAYLPTVEGDRVLMIEVRLRGGGRWRLAVPPALASRFRHPEERRIATR